MALHLRADFAKLIGRESKYVSVYVKRGKIVMSGDYVDDAHPINKIFLNNFFNKNSANPAPDQVGEIPEPRKTTTNNKVGPPRVPTPSKPNIQPPDESYFSVEARKKLLEVEKLEEEIRLLKIKAEKAEGILIPTEVVKSLFAQHFKSVYIVFEQAAMNLLSEIAGKTSMSSADQARFTGRIIEMLNKSVDEGIEISAQDLDKIAIEYSETRSRGERK